MTIYSYPSEQFPQFPSIQLSTPEDWEPATVPGAVLAARAVRPPARFAPNVMVTVSRYTAQFGRDEAMELLHESLRRHPEAKVEEPFTAAFGPDDYMLVNVVFDDPVGGTLVQVHGYSSFPIGPAHPEHRDVVQIMGTCTAVDASTDYPLLQQVMESLRVTPAAAPVTTPE